jgi:hypothetical protein
MASLASVAGPHQALMAAVDQLAERLRGKPTVPDYFEVDTI